MRDADAHAAQMPAPLLAALALELRPGSQPTRRQLAQADVGMLAEHIAHDLATFQPDAAQLDLVTVGALYDPVELLRPGWPLHHAFAQLAARAPRGGDADHGRIIAFGAAAGQLPGALAPDPEYAEGPLRLLPLLLDGDAVILQAVTQACERDLLEHGMAGAATALAAQDLFGLEVEHARYLTVHDLAAMTALQYEHAGLAPLWPLLETALLAPGDECWLDATPEPLLHYIDGEARIALFPPAAWHARYAPELDKDDARLPRRFAQFQARQQQFAAVLRAHAVPVTFAFCAQATPEL